MAAPAPLTVHTLQNRERLVLYTLAILCQHSQAETAGDVILSIHTIPSTHMMFTDAIGLVCVSVPGFVHTTTLRMIEDILRRTTAAGWTIHTSQSSYTVTPVYRYAHIRFAYTLSDLEPMLVGAMIRAHRACDETSLPFRHYIHGLHIQSMVSLPPDVVLTRLMQWSRDKTRIGPFQMTLNGSSFEATAMVEHQCDTENECTHIFRLNVDTCNA
jgi:hypothetical protein